MGLEKSKLE